VPLERLLGLGEQLCRRLAHTALGQLLLVPDDAALRRKLDDAAVHVAVPEKITAAGAIGWRRQLAVEEFGIGAVGGLDQVGQVDVALGIDAGNGAVQALPDDGALGLAVLAD